MQLTSDDNGHEGKLILNEEFFDRHMRIDSQVMDAKVGDESAMYDVEDQGRKPNCLDISAYDLFMD